MYNVLTAPNPAETIDLTDPLPQFEAEPKPLEQWSLWQRTEQRAHELNIPDEQLESAKGLVEKLNQHSPYTCAHCMRVADNSAEVAEMLGADQKAAFLAGLVHDVAKINVPREILHKPARLTDEELEVVNRHSEEGHDMVEATGKFPEAVPQAIGSHHVVQERNSNGMDDSDFSVATRKVRDSLTIADIVDAVFRNDGYSDKNSFEDNYRRALGHIHFVLDQDIYDDIQEKESFAIKMLDHLLAKRAVLIETAAGAIALNS